MSKLITVDAGHGGFDNGASHNGRLEKDDNLRLALEVEKRLKEQGQRVQMTRDTDVFIPLRTRTDMANQAGSDLFVSLHRNSYTELTPTSNGVENWVYTTAPASTEQAAANVLNQVVSVGVQADRGVKRGNYSVLRRSKMPAMLLEMGYIINDEDNRLFDTYLDEYAEAIVRGILETLGEPYTPPGQTPPPPTAYDPTTAAIQQMLNDWYGANLTVDGRYGNQTKAALIRAMQSALNQTTGSNLTVDGVLGPATLAQLPVLRELSRGPLVYLFQAALYMSGYNPGTIDGVFGSNTRNALIRFQQDRGLTADGVAGPNTYRALLG
ncbi:N-acetylmuramoyl-L-alanine amidase [Oscillospiraceae bacterium MB08-C2-2]|nr:N-acetylmuramoyl-L-alanine amidase [Oscillospiraceae bacterium MB08-C2-2]